LYEQDAPYMQCALCSQLKREYSVESQQEAKATLIQRSVIFSGSNRDDRMRYETLQRQIELSRKKQSALAGALDRHLLSHDGRVEKELARCAS
jgi:hypothetical protein